MRKSTTGEIYRFIKCFDNDTIIRKTNMRTFSKKENLDYTVCQGKWMIDMDMFLKAINPKKTKKSIPFPRIRTKASARREWNATHRRKIKHYIIDRICASGKVFVYKHGRTNIINYDQLEAEIKKELKRRNEY